jgi:uncharacterized repeat protein (TIGR03803 family)
VTTSLSTPQESLVYTFKGDPDGAGPYTNLIQGSNGDFYGTTEEGGSAQEGTIFEVTAGGKQTVLFSFPNQTDGAYPTLPLTQGPNGLLYGAATDCAGGGCSQAGLFDITTKGVYKNLYLYPLVCSNCGQPEAPLLLSTNGTLYSPTEQGGTGVGSFYREQWLRPLHLPSECEIRRRRRAGRHSGPGFQLEVCRRIRRHKSHHHKTHRHHLHSRHGPDRRANRRRHCHHWTDQAVHHRELQYHADLQKLQAPERPSRNSSERSRRVSRAR